jgi:hypothetical protein
LRATDVERCTERRNECNANIFYQHDAQSERFLQHVTDAHFEDETKRQMLEWHRKTPPRKKKKKKNSRVSSAAKITPPCSGMGCCSCELVA